MQIIKSLNVKIEAISAVVPTNTIDNRDVAKINFPKDNFESVINALGIEKRHIIRNTETTSLDLSVEAAKVLLDNYNIDRNTIGAVVFVTLTPDNLMPNNACFAQAKLNLPETIPAFDVNHACSGYVYGLYIASLISNNIKRKVLLLDGDVNTKYVSKWDKATGLLFGDAGSATIISPTEESEWTFGFITDGSKREVLIIPSLGFRNNLQNHDLEYREYEDGSKRRMIDLKMRGEEVFNYVVNTVSKYSKNFMEEQEFIPQEYNWLLLHQANAFMIRQLARKLGFDKNQVPLSINKYGNTSSVSIPLNICSELKENIRERQRCFMIGMGAGLSTGVCSIEIGPAISPGVIEIDL